MNLDRITIVIRPRHPAEAVDLGYRLVRAWWRPVYAAWLTVALPLWALAFALGWKLPWLVLAVLWWLRPLADRAALHVVSHGVFSDFPGWRRTLRAWPSLWKRQIWATLLFFRLDPARSFHLPVFQLEGLNGEARRQRFKVLNSEGMSQAVMLTFGSAWIELCLFHAALAFLGLLSPVHEMGETIGLGYVALVGRDPGAVPLLAVAAFAAHALTAPGWVAGGFTLYLSARTRLEGWDVQLAFRRLASRLRQGAAAVVAFACLALPLVAQPTFAQQPAPAEAGGAQGEDETYEAYRAVREVLSGPDFETEREVVRWEPRDWWSDVEVPDGQAPRGLLGLGAGIGELLRLLLIALAVAAAVWLVVEMMRRRDRVLPLERNEAIEPVAPSFGAVEDEEPLPDDVPAAARELWRQGRPAAALGLLYRGALAALEARGGRPIEASWTEQECRRELASALAPPAAAYFATLTDGWTAAAYAHRPPGDEAIEGLVRDWPRHFREAA